VDQRAKKGENPSIPQLDGLGGAHQKFCN